MEQSLFEYYRSKAKELKSQRFKLSEKPSLKEVIHFLEIENAVEKFFSDISISGDAEADNILTLQSIVGGDSQKKDMQRASMIKDSLVKNNSFENK